MAFDVKEVLDAKSPFQKTFGEDYDVRRGVDMNNIRGTARQVYGDPIEYDQDKLFDLERRASRLTPLNNVQAGSGAIPGNPYSIDTRNLMTGVSNFAVGAINRERNRRVMGDPKAVEKFTNRAASRQNEAGELRDERTLQLPGVTTGTPMPIETSDPSRRERRLQRGAARDLARAERYGGFGRELQSLRTRQQQELDRQTKEQDFIEKEAGNELEANRKREETMTKGTIDMIRDIKRDEARMAVIGVQGQNVLNAIERRHEKDLEMEKWKQTHVVDNNKIPPSILQGLRATMDRSQSLAQRERYWVSILNDRMALTQAKNNGYDPIDEIEKIKTERDEVARAIGEMYQSSGAIPEEAMKSFWELFDENEEEGSFDFNVFEDN